MMFVTYIESTGAGEGLGRAVGNYGSVVKEVIVGQG